MRRFRLLVYFWPCVVCFRLCEWITCLGTHGVRRSAVCASSRHGLSVGKANSALRVRSCRLQVRVVLGTWRWGLFGLLSACSANSPLNIGQRCFGTSGPRLSSQNQPHTVAGASSTWQSTCSTELRASPVLPSRNRRCRRSRSQRRDLGCQMTCRRLQRVAGAFCTKREAQVRGWKACLQQRRSRQLPLASKVYPPNKSFSSVAVTHGQCLGYDSPMERQPALQRFTA